MLLVEKMLMRSGVTLPTCQFLYTWGRNSDGQLGHVETTGTPQSWTAVASANFTTVGINSSSKLFGWGQVPLGDNQSASFRSCPIQLGNDNWTSISTNQYNRFAIRSDGRLFGWGAASVVGIGDGLTIARSSPVQIGSSSWTAISASRGSGTANHMLAIRSDGLLFAWGRNQCAQLGLGVIPDTLVSSAHGASANLQVRTDGTLWVWGRNNYGQLGLGDSNNRSSPTQIGSAVNWSIVAGYNCTSFAVTNTGILWGWGRNFNGQVGDNTSVDRSSPVQIGSNAWCAVTASLNGANAIRTDGTLWGWGSNGVGANAVCCTWGAPNTWNVVNGARYHTLGIDTTGNLWSWGCSLNGALGHNLGATTVGRCCPTQVGTNLWTAVAAASSASLAIRNDGTLWAWGWAQPGILGNNNGGFGGINRSSPTQIGSSTWTAVASRYCAAHAIRSDGTLWGWGYGTNGILGLNSTFPRSSVVQLGTSLWTAISHGGHALAIRSGGTLFAWGFNGGGQLGDRTTVNKSSPVQVGSDSWVAISAGGAHSFGIKSGNTLWAWGSGYCGRTGLNNTVLYSSPVQVGASTWNCVAAGDLHAIAIRSDNTLWAWGNNAGGRLGDGTTVSKSSPTQIGTNTNWDRVFCASASGGSVGRSFARTTNSCLWGWGSRTAGNIGDNTSESLGICGRSSPILIGNNFRGINLSSPVQIGTCLWSRVCSGNQHTVAIRQGGTLFTWGPFTAGLLGNNVGVGTTDFESFQVSPVQVGSSSWTAVSAGRFGNLAIRSDNTLWGWGCGYCGQLGLINSVFTNFSSPVQIGSSSWTAVGAATFGTTAAIRSDGTLWSWGNGASGLIGDGTSVNKSSPIQLGSSTWTALKTGTAIASRGAIRTGGTFWQWGSGSCGILATGDTINRSSPVQIGGGVDLGDKLSPTQIGANSWIAVSAGQCHSLAIRFGGSLWAWGDDFWGNVSLNRGGSGSNACNSPTQIGASTWSAISAGAVHSVALRSDNTLWAWGNNYRGQLGTNTTVCQSSPVQVGVGTWTCISANGCTTAAIATGGTLWSWGTYTATGVANSFRRSSPTQIGSETWSGLGIGEFTSGAIRSGLLYMWGLNASGDVGVNDTIARSSPTLLGNNESRTSRSSPTQVGTGCWTAIASGRYHSVALRSNNLLFTWGSNFKGQLGTNQNGVTANRSSPTQIGSSSWTAVSGGEQSSFAIRSDGMLFSWGCNISGMLGLGLNVTDDRSSPTQIGSSSWTAISKGSTSNTKLGITSAGTLFAWGRGLEGQIGDFTAADKSSPVQIGSNSWVAIAGSQGHQMALASNRLLYSWGANSAGQLGHNDLVNKSSPTQIGSNSWNAIAAGQAVNFSYQHSLAIRSDNLLFAWGAAAYGMLGDNQRTARRSSPTQIGSNNWTAVSAGSSFSGAITTAGNLFMWGEGLDGQLGNSGVGTLQRRSSPTQVGTGRWCQVEADHNHTLGTCRIP